MTTPKDSRIPTKPVKHPFQRAVLRGLAVILPSLLTVILLLWLWNAVRTYVLAPIESGARRVMVHRIADYYPEIPDDVPESAIRKNRSGELVEFHHRDRDYVRLLSGEWVPKNVFEVVRRNPGKQFPTTARAVFDRYVESRWMRPATVVPIVFSLFLLVVYLLGKFIAARLGRILFAYFERLIAQVPFIRTIYGTVKQVTDILFSESQHSYNRVVAIEYPRTGIWSLGFVTGESFPIIAEVAMEPVLSVLIPTSPMPATGYTINVRKSEALDLGISVDQAFQFIVSCGFVTGAPPRDPAALPRPGGPPAGSSPPSRP